MSPIRKIAKSLPAKGQSSAATTTWPCTVEHCSFASTRRDTLLRHLRLLHGLDASDPRYPKPIQSGPKGQNVGQEGCPKCEFRTDIHKSLLSHMSKKHKVPKQEAEELLEAQGNGFLEAGEEEDTPVVVIHEPGTLVNIDDGQPMDIDKYAQYLDAIAPAGAIAGCEPSTLVHVSAQ